jgi:hypothetical protein
MRTKITGITCSRGLSVYRHLSREHPLWPGFKDADQAALPQPSLPWRDGPVDLEHSGPGNQHRRGAKWGAIIGRHKAAWSLLGRSIFVI